MANTPDTAQEPLAAPLAVFSNCHQGILTRLESLGEMPQLVAAAQRARAVASDTIDLFELAVLPHHEEEEGDLFPAVIASSAKGPEREWAIAAAAQLTQEHRAVEAMWKRLRPAFKALAAGRSADIDGTAVGDLMRTYAAHARFEEEAFLPLAQAILARNANHLAALDIALHVRHAPRPSAYI